jgi:hypothetical protein
VIFLLRNKSGINRLLKNSAREGYGLQPVHDEIRNDGALEAAGGRFPI